MDEMDAIKAKLADIEDRSRRNNKKMRGVPKSVHQSELCKYASQLFMSILPDLTELDITVHRIHRLPKPSHLPDNIPRDVILCFHFCQVKERLMAASHTKDLFPAQYKDLQFFS